MAELCRRYHPKLIVAGASAFPRDWDYAKMRSIADECGALLMADIAHISGIVATRRCNNPFLHCDIVTTTTHKTLRGPRGAMIFSKKGKISEAIDMSVFPGLQGGPHNNNIAAIAVSLQEASTDEFDSYIHQVLRNAKCLSDAMINHGYKIVTNGTDNHIVLWDIRPLSISSHLLQTLFEKVDISVNKNSIFGDTSAFNPGGIRLGTPTVTTIGMKEQHMRLIADMINLTVAIGHKINKIMKENKSNTLLSCEEVISNDEGIETDIANIRREVHSLRSKI
jgi:glycine hydroxymethyltransferase